MNKVIITFEIFFPNKPVGTFNKTKPNATLARLGNEQFNHQIFLYSSDLICYKLLFSEENSNFWKCNIWIFAMYLYRALIVFFLGGGGEIYIVYKWSWPSSPLKRLNFVIGNDYIECLRQWSLNFSFHALLTDKVSF